MIQADMQFTPVSQAHFSALIDEMQEVTKAEMPKVIRNVSRDFCRSAMKVTPLARRLTEADFQEDGGYLVTTKHKKTGKTVQFIGTKEQFTAARKSKRLLARPGQFPKGRGYARIGWVKALVMLGVPIKLKQIKADVVAINKTGDFVDGMSHAQPYSEIANRVPYIEKLDKGGPGVTSHNIMARAMAATATSMERTLTKLSERMAKNWNK